MIGNFGLIGIYIPPFKFASYTIYTAI